MARPSARQSPFCFENKDWKNWQESLPIEDGDPAKHKRVASPRPGHADLAGALKYNFSEARYVLERASARESAARVAIGALAKLFLRELGMEVLSHVVSVGAVSLCSEVSWEQIRAICERNEVLLNCADVKTEQGMKDEVDKVLRTGDSVGGVFEVVAHGVPPGLGTYVQWDERLDGLLAGAVMSLQAVKAVEIGSGVTAAAAPDPPFTMKSVTRLKLALPDLAATGIMPEGLKVAFPTARTSGYVAI